MKILSFLLFLLLTFTSAEATIWRVNNTLSVPDQVDFNELIDAVASSEVAGGDTIYVEGSATPYLGGIDVFKPLVIIGPSYFKSQPNLQPVACDNLPATVLGDPGITFYSGGSGSMVTGMTLTSTAGSNSGAIHLVESSNITITRNYLRGIYFSPGTFSNSNETNTITIHRNIICDEIYFASYNTVNGLSITNNLINSSIDQNPSTSNGVIQQNLVIFNNNITGSVEVEGANIQYNYIGGTIWEYQDNSVVSLNLFQNSNSNNLAIVASDSTNEINGFVYQEFPNCGNDNWQLQPQYLTTTHGAYNGLDPYYDLDDPISPANLPAIPVIYECDVPPVGDQTITISVSVRGNN